MTPHCPLSVPRAFVALVLAALAASGCAQHARVICEPLALMHEGGYEAAVVALDETKLAKSERDAFLYHAQRGHLLHLAGDYAESNREFERAVAVADGLEPVSVTATLTDYMFNEAVKAYPGEDYERAYLHYYMMLNYLEMDDLEGALVEARRLDLAFRKLDARYEEGTRRYQDDGFIRYLSGLVYEAQGKREDAFIDYLLAARAYSGETGQGARMDVPDGLVASLACLGRELGREDEVHDVVDLPGVAVAPDSLGAPDSSLAPRDPRMQVDLLCPVPDGYGEIVVVVDSGWAPYKREESIEVPIHRALVPEELRGRTNLAAVVKIAYPVYESASGEAGMVQAGVAQADSGTCSSPDVTVWSEKVQDMDALARWTLDRRIGAVKFRSTLRATSKQIALAKAKHDQQEKRDEDSDEDWIRSPYKEKSFWTWLFGWLFEDLVTHAVAETEQADTRSWVTLPAEMGIARIAVEPGEYDLCVGPVGGGAPRSLGRVTVRAGEKVFRSVRVYDGRHPVRCE